MRRVAKYRRHSTSPVDNVICSAARRRLTISGRGMKAEGSRDPQWDLVIEIAAKLWVYGEYVAEVDPLPTQRFVDLQWAARQAGRVLGSRPTVHVGQPRGAENRRVTVTVTYRAPEGQDVQRAEAGLETLMRMVLERQAGG
jgi:hypothetical protein